MGERLVVGDVVHADPIDVGAPSVRRPEYVAPDPAEAVDSDPQGHSVFPSLAGGARLNLPTTACVAAYRCPGGPRPPDSRPGPRRYPPSARQSPLIGASRR